MIDRDMFYVMTPSTIRDVQQNRSSHAPLHPLQVVNATQGLTFSKTPEFQYKLLAQDTGDVEQLRADSQATTYDAAHVGE